MSTALSPMRSIARAISIGPQRHLDRRLVEAALDDPPYEAVVSLVDDLVELDQRLGLLEIALDERVHRRCDHAAGLVSHHGEVLEQLRSERLLAEEPAQLRDVDALVADPLQVLVHVDHGEHEPQVDGDGRLACEQRLDAVLDLEIHPIDVVVAGDHGVGRIGLRLDQRLEGAVEHALAAGAPPR